MDLVVADASVVDGSGAPAYRATVGVAEGRIAFVRRAEPATMPDAAPGDHRPAAARTIDAAGRTLAPGFIDVHTHSDLAPFTDPWMDSSLRQGVTTVVVGNCGMSAWPRGGLGSLASFLSTTPEALPDWTVFDDYLDAVDRARPACNVAALVGFGSLRGEIMGHERRPASPVEVAAMRRLLGDAMPAGALGVSTGLIYVPDMYASTDELVAVTEAVAPFGGVYASHMRAEGRLVFDAVREAVAVGRDAGVHTHISHLKLEGRRVWGLYEELLALVDAGEASADQYPYTAWETDLASFLPPWAPISTLDEVLADPPLHERLVRAIEMGEPGWESSVADSGWEHIVLETRDADLAGRDVAAVAAERGLAPADLALDLLRREPAVTVRGHAMDENDVREILSCTHVMVASDGVAVSPEGPLWGAPLHPRSYGTFPRVLGRYVRGAGVLSLEAAVRKMTSVPAGAFGLSGRGLIREGAAADLVLLDPETVADPADFGDAHRYPDGVEMVVVGGRVAWDGARGERAGRALRRGQPPVRTRRAV